MYMYIKYANPEPQLWLYPFHVICFSYMSLNYLQAFFSCTPPLPLPFEFTSTSHTP